MSSHRKIYTKRGDSGQTDLFGAGRISKSSPRIEAIGAVDELNAFLGAADAELDARNADLLDILAVSQARLFELGADLAAPKSGSSMMEENAASGIERGIDLLEAELPPLKQFILPRGNRAAAAFHTARAVCRRAERRVASLAEKEPVNPSALIFLNRLSDLLFVAARVVVLRDGQEETVWTPKEKE